MGGGGRRGRGAGRRLAGVVLALGVTAALAGADEGRSLAVRVAAEGGPYFVGQAIAVQARTVAGAERPEFAVPRVEGADVVAAGLEGRPLAVSGIGDVTSQTVAYTRRYRITPRRPGTIVVPPIRAGVAGRSGAGGPLRLEVRPLPAAGQPGAFLGGVGALDGLEAEAEPRAVRVGQELEFRLRIEGPAARGSTRWPDAGPIVRAAAGLEVGRRGVEAADDPPARTFRWRLRPTAPGPVTIPPLRVASFDPAAQRYFTRATRAVTVRVEDVPRFDPGTLDLGPTPPPEDRSSRAARAAVRVLMGLGGGAVAAGILFAAVRRIRRARRADPSRRARRLARALDPSWGDERAAAAITEALADYLVAAVGRPPGVLTPEEARRGVAQGARSAELAARAGRLVAACDRARFGGRAGSPGALVAEARGLLLALAQGEGRGGAGGESEGGTSHRLA